MSTTIDRCAVVWCQSAVDLEWSADVCPHQIVTCERCRFEDACQDCADGETCS